jgi:hypothetical protein
MVPRRAAFLERCLRAAAAGFTVLPFELRPGGSVEIPLRLSPRR